MYHCKELNRPFSTQKEMFAALKENKQLIIEAKKAATKNSDPFFCTGSRVETKEAATKAATGIEFGDYIYPVINTTWWLDSHKDLHIDGIWDKSAKEQNGKTYYIINHDLALGSVISYPKEVEIMIKQMGWRDLGYAFDGVTEALIFKAKITDKSNAAAVAAFKDGEEIQNSVRMVYMSLDLAVNSTSEDFKEEKRIWDKYAARVVNQDALKDGYFWPIYEAKIYKEGSAVLFGSNEATPVLYEQPKQHIAPPTGTQRRAANSTRAKQLNNLLKTFTK